MKQPSIFSVDGDQNIILETFFENNVVHVTLQCPDFQYTHAWTWNGGMHFWTQSSYSSAQLDVLLRAFS